MIFFFFFLLVIRIRIADTYIRVPNECNYGEKKRKGKNRLEMEIRINYNIITNILFHIRS